MGPSSRLILATTLVLAVQATWSEIARQQAGFLGWTGVEFGSVGDANFLQTAALATVGGCMIILKHCPPLRSQYSEQEKKNPRLLRFM